MRPPDIASMRLMRSLALPGPVDEQVTAEIIAETEGNPLALLELPRVFRAGELAGGFGLLGGADLSGSIEESFHRRFEALHADTRRLLLLVAAEPLGDPLLVWRAATYLGIDPAAARQAVDSELAVFGTDVERLVKCAAKLSAEGFLAASHPAMAWVVA